MKISSYFIQALATEPVNHYTSNLQARIVACSVVAGKFYTVF